MQSEDVDTFCKRLDKTLTKFRKRYDDKASGMLILRVELILICTMTLIMSSRSMLNSIVCQEMFAMEYFRKFCELYTTHENTNREDLDVVASKRHVNRLWCHCIITSTEILLFQAHTEHYLQVSLLLPLIHSQQQSLSNWLLLQNRDQHYFQPLACKSILQASLDQELRHLCRYGDPSYSFHKRTLVSFSHVE